jgi:hypothetical protein
MKKLFLFFAFQLLSSFIFGQDENKYMWNGKPIAYKAWRDSLRFEYFKYCDSLKKQDTGLTVKQIK